MREPRSIGPARVDPADRAQLAESPVSLRRVGALFKPYRWTVATVMLLITASSLVSLATPFLVRRIIDDALPNQNVRLLAFCVGAMLAINAGTSVLGVLQTLLSTRVGQNVMHGLRTAVFGHLQQQSLGFFTRTKGGEVQSRLTNDIGGMQSVVTSTATSIASNVTVVVGTAVAMVALSWQLSLLSLVVLPPSIWLTRRVARMRREMTSRRQRSMAELLSQVEEGLSIHGVQLAKTLGTGKAMTARFTQSSRGLADLEVQSQLAGRWQMSTMSMVFGGIPALIYLVAGLPFTSGHMTIGTVVAFATLQSGLFRPLSGLLNTSVSITSSMALFSRIFEYLDLPVDIADPARPRTLDPGRVQGEVRLDGVSFTYPGSDRPAVHDVDIDVPAGASLALVGETGSGKTTLASLVARLYDPTRGRVCIDGVDVRDLTLANLSRVVGVVSQETYLLHTTIADNLRYAKPDATDDELQAAAAAAHIHDQIMSLPDAYETVVGPRGYRFSGGEKQRIAIARTLLRDPRVLVLDEATSALDNETERAVQAALDVVSRGRTTITIAHRLSTVRNCDEIVVLDHGGIVERGTHAELLAADGRYARLAGAAEANAVLPTSLDAALTPA